MYVCLLQPGTSQQCICCTVKHLRDLTAEKGKICNDSFEMLVNKLIPPSFWIAVVLGFVLPAVLLWGYNLGWLLGSLAVAARAPHVMVPCRRAQLSGRVGWAGGALLIAEPDCRSSTCSVSAAANPFTVQLIRLLCSVPRRLGAPRL